MFTLVSQFLVLSEDSWPEIPGRAKYSCGAHGNVTFFLRQDRGGQMGTGHEARCRLHYMQIN